MWQVLHTADNLTLWKVLHGSSGLFFSPYIARQQVYNRLQGIVDFHPYFRTCPRHHGSETRRSCYCPHGWSLSQGQEIEREQSKDRCQICYHFKNAFFSSRKISITLVLPHTLIILTLEYLCQSWPGSLPFVLYSIYVMNIFQVFFLLQITWGCHIADIKKQAPIGFLSFST